MSGNQNAGKGGEETVLRAIGLLLRLAAASIRPQDPNALERIRLQVRLSEARDAQQAAAAHRAAVERARQARVRARTRRSDQA